MAFQTGSVSSFTSLHGIVDTFLTSNGWTQDGNVLYKGNVYVELASVDNSHFRVYGGQGQTAGVLSDQATQYGQMRHSVIKDSGTSSMGNLGSINQYYLFVHTNPDFVAIVIRYDLIWVQWMTFGELDKYSSYTGGQYFGATYPSSIDTTNTRYEFGAHWANTNDTNGNYAGTGIGFWYGGFGDSSTSSNMGVYCDIDGNDWLTNCRFTNGWPVKGKAKVEGEFCGAALTSDLVTRNPNTWNDQTILAQILVTQRRPENKMSIIGNPVHARLTNVKNHNIGDIVTLGADRWMVFPHLKKGTATLSGQTDTTTGNSGRLGFAIKYDGV